MKDQSNHIHGKISEAKKAFPELDSVLWDRVYDLLWDSLCSVDLNSFVINKIGDGVEVRWNQEGNTAWAQFHPSTTDWAWGATTVRSDGRDHESDTGYSVTYEHNGLCSYIIRDTPHYFFPDDVEKIISTPDAFSKEYYPHLESYQYFVVWVTNKYDGMLSGYCRVNGKLHYFDCIEETYYQRKRMYAVYELSLYERLKVWMQYHKWHFVVNTSWARRIGMWLYRYNKHTTSEQYQKNKQAFERAHDIVGYFEK